MGRTTKVVNFSLPVDLYKKTKNLACRRKKIISHFVGVLVRLEMPTIKGNRDSLKSP